MGHDSAFHETAQILGLAVLFGFLGQRFKQPLIIMFLATGILVGPSVFGIVDSYESIALFAEIGIALLLFIVGLKLDLGLIRATGPVALATGVGQIVFTSAIGFIIAMAAGMTVIEGAYVSVALTFSSTIIIVKLLSDKKEIDSLHGRIAVGFLIVQDVAAIVALVGLTTFGGELGPDETAWGAALAIALKGGLFLGAIALMMRYVLPIWLKWLAASQEMLLLFAIAWAVSLGALGDWLGFSKEVGAFLAGVSLASTDYRDAIGARLTSLRDFLLLFFFIHLGARLEWDAVGARLGLAGLLSIFVLIGNPLIVMVIMGYMGYRRRTGLLAGLTVAQISEFSLIVAALGVSLGHIGPEIMGLITLVGVVTIFLSTYMILYSGPLYKALQGPLRIFERRNAHRESAAEGIAEPESTDVILVGLGSYGSGVAEHLLERKKRIVAVDFDPSVLSRWSDRQTPVIYADMGDPEILEYLPLRDAQWVVSTVRVPALNLALLKMLKQRGFGGKVGLTAASRDEARVYETAGAHVVLRPFRDAAEQAADALTHAMDMMPKDIDWPVAFQEIRLRSGSTYSGHRIRDIPLRPLMGVSILAVSRAGRVFYDPEPDFAVYPGDRLALMGPPHELRQAEELLNQIQDAHDEQERRQFALADVEVAADSPRAGKTFAELQFRQAFRVTVVGIRRADSRIVLPGPGEAIAGGDHLVVIGLSDAIESMQAQAPL